MSTRLTSAVQMINLDNDSAEIIVITGYIKVALEAIVLARASFEFALPFTTDKSIVLNLNGTLLTSALARELYKHGNLPWKKVKPLTDIS